MRREKLAFIAAICGFVATVTFLMWLSSNKVDRQPSDYYSLILKGDWVIDYNLTLEDCLKEFDKLTKHGSCSLQPQGEIR